MNAYYTHPSCTIDKGCIVGKGTKIWHYSHIYNSAKIGKNCVIGQNVMVGPNVTIGNNCKIQNNVSIYEGVVLEDNIFIGPSVVFTNVLLPRANIEQKDNFLKTYIKNGCTIGANTTIVAGNTLGEYCMIGAGSLVTKNIEEFSMNYGTPAKFRYKIDKFGKKV